jgi:hypothetical protein
MSPFNANKWCNIKIIGKTSLNGQGQLHRNMVKTLWNDSIQGSVKINQNFYLHSIIPKFQPKWENVSYIN